MAEEKRGPEDDDDDSADVVVACPPDGGEVDVVVDQDRAPIFIKRGSFIVFQGFVSAAGRPILLGEEERK